MIYELIKKGYGNYEDILNMDMKVFFDIVNYENFLKDYEYEYNERLKNKG